jgi:hypothetical protein
MVALSSSLFQANIMLRNELHETLLAPESTSIELTDLDETKASPAVTPDGTALVTSKPLCFQERK